MNQEERQEEQPLQQHRDNTTTESQEQQVDVGEEERVTPELRACILKVSGVEFSVPVEFLVEIVEIEEVFHLPLAPEYIAGMIHYRGRAVPLIDIGVLHNKSAKSNLTGATAIVTEYAGELIAFVSDELPRLGEEFQGEVIEMGEFFDAYRVR